MASHQQSVGIDPERGTGHQRYIVLAFLNLQQTRVRGQYRVDAVHFVGQCVAQYMDVEHIALCKLVDVRKQLGTRHAAVGRQYRVGAAAAHWQGSPYHMAD